MPGRSQSLRLLNHYPTPIRDSVQFFIFLCYICFFSAISASKIFHLFRTVCVIHSYLHCFCPVALIIRFPVLVTGAVSFPDHLCHKKRHFTSGASIVDRESMVFTPDSLYQHFLPYHHHDIDVYLFVNPIPYLQ